MAGSHALLLDIAGFRHWAYRKRAIQSLALQPGDTMSDWTVESGTNVDLNFEVHISRTNHCDPFLAGLKVLDCQCHVSAKYLGCDLGVVRQTV